jgi:hypothetical protein
MSSLIASEIVTRVQVRSEAKWCVLHSPSRRRAERSAPLALTEPPLAVTAHQPYKRYGYGDMAPP